MATSQTLQNYQELCYRLFLLLRARQKRIEKYIDNLQEREFVYKNDDKSHYKEENVCLQSELSSITQSIDSINEQIKSLSQQANQSEIELPLEQLAQKHTLTQEQKLVVLYCFYSKMDYAYPYGKDVLHMLGYTDDTFIANSAVLFELIDKKLVYKEGDHYGTLFTEHICLCDKTMRFLVGGSLAKQMFFEDINIKDNTLTLLNIRKPILTFDQIVLDTDKKTALDSILFQARNAKQLFRKWGLNNTIKYGKGTTILFYGPPGTGKTAICEAIAHYLKKKIGLVNYAQLINKWVGESEKRLVEVFRLAKESGCVLVFDEADSLFAKRLNEDTSVDRLHNYMTNILMQEIENFDGVCLLTTNRAPVLDDAFARRILLQLEIAPPKAKERAQIWRTLIPRQVPLAEDIDLNELGEKFELTGGEIKNIVIRAVMESAYRGEEKIKKDTILKLIHENLSLTVSKRMKTEVGFGKH